ncbi:MAG TPA: hypothetical protein VJ653_03640 [Acidimicrobiales bacterium]|nr:hypothetical protein [Acidimicrobiales bacterium]
MRKALLLIPLAGLLTFGPIGSGVAQTASSSFGVFRADLAPVAENPEATGFAYLVRNGDRLTGVIYARGLSPNLPHAMHIHGLEQAAAECPGINRDVNGDGLVDTLEGIVDYGPILVSFTTVGATGGNLLPDGLDLSRYSKANRAGFLTYSRTFSIPAAVADRLGDLHIVVHGHDLNGNGAYDGAASSLSAVVGAPVPLEAELPVACGPINSLR